MAIDIWQAAGLIAALAHHRRQDLIDAWNDARSRGRLWRQCLDAGVLTLVQKYPKLRLIEALTPIPELNRRRWL